MAKSHFSAAQAVWCFLFVAFGLAAVAKVGVLMLAFAIGLAILTPFLVIRGILRWTGRQLRGGA